MTSRQDLEGLSENELHDIIENAEKALKVKQESKRKEVHAQIKELAASIGASVEIHEGDKRSVRKGIKIAPKYQNPHNPSQKWTGRGVAPKWFQALLDSGMDKTQLEI
ncbi:MAG: H-NS histone family protein [Gammaproteobacteria bacterium]